MKHCTRCKKNRPIIIDWSKTTQEKSGLVSSPERWNIRLCYQCITDLFRSIWDLMDESDEIKLIKKIGEQQNEKVNSNDSFDNKRVSSPTS